MVIDSHSVQLCPPNPLGQAQISGTVQIPSLAHGGSQNAAEIVFVGRRGASSVALMPWQVHCLLGVIFLCHINRKKNVK